MIKERGVALKFTYQKWQNDSKSVKLKYGRMTWSFIIFVTLKDDQISNPIIYITSEGSEADISSFSENLSPSSGIVDT